MDDKKMGRPSLGVTKKVSITLPDHLWGDLDSIVSLGVFNSRSAFLRAVVTDAIREFQNGYSDFQRKLEE